MVTLTDRTYKTNKSPAGTLGHPGNSYPLKIDSKPFLGLDKETAAKFAFPTKNDGELYGFLLEPMECESLFS